jgi:hypothetical protein
MFGRIVENLGTELYRVLNVSEVNLWLMPVGKIQKVFFGLYYRHGMGGVDQITQMLGYGFFVRLM